MGLVRSVVLNTADSLALANLRQRLEIASEEVEEEINQNNGVLPDYPIPESPLPPNAFRELMPPSQTFGEGDA